MNLPCPHFVNTKDGRRYCQQGEIGHWGTCCGDRTQDEYNRLCSEVLESQKEKDG